MFIQNKMKEMKINALQSGVIGCKSVNDVFKLMRVRISTAPSPEDQLSFRSTKIAEF